jgi:hypothetical protein
MNNASISQIFYSQSTRLNLDPGFIPFENVGNIRSDWREYWPIRNYLLNNTLDENIFYGFLSPKFREKTGLAAADCYEFIGSADSSVDVISFSPFFDIGAWHQNSFFQAMQKHPNAVSIIEESIAILDPSITLEKLVMHSGNNIFCNYFVAKPKFWKVWLNKCEKIFKEAETGLSPLGIGLNVPAEGHHSNAPIKTFIIERVASLILASNDLWSVKAYNPFLLPLAPTLISRELIGLMQLDALKIAYAQTKRDEYLSLFLNIRNLISKKINNESS